MFGGRPIQTDDIALLLVSLPFWGIVICGVRALRSMHPLYKQYGKYTPFYLHEGRFIINKMRMWSLRPQLFLARHIAFPVTAIDRVLIGCASDGDRYSMSVRVRTKDGRVSPIYWFSPGVYSPAKMLHASKADIKVTMRRTAALLASMHLPCETAEEEEWRPFLW